MTITHRITSNQNPAAPGGDIASQLSGLIGQAQALSSAGVGLPGIQSIGSVLSGLGSSITGAGGTTDIASAITGLGTQLSSITSLSGASGLLSSLSSQLSSLTSMLNPAGLLSQVLHMHVLDKAKGIIASAFQGQHKTTWDQNGVTHTSSVQVTHQAPLIQHNGNVNMSDILNVVKTIASGANITAVTSIVGQSFGMLSDLRLKRKVKALRPVLSDVLKLKPSTFEIGHVDWVTDQPNMDNAKPSLGLIAQQVQDIFPDIVRRNGEYLVLQESKIGILLLGALQEFVTETRAEIQALKAEIAELKRP